MIGVEGAAIDLNRDAVLAIGEVDLGDDAPLGIAHGVVSNPRAGYMTQKSRHPVLSLRTRSGCRACSQVPEDADSPVPVP